MAMEPARDDAPISLVAVQADHELIEHLDELDPTNPHTDPLALLLRGWRDSCRRGD